MNPSLRESLIEIAKNEIPSEDVSHDFEHTHRVLINAEMIARSEGGDLDIIIPASLFHDLIVYQKNHPKSKDSQIESAHKAEKILLNIEEYPKNKIEKVKTCILECSFTKNIPPSSKESAIVQDADKLESTGVISIMRTFSSTGQIKRPFYNPEDPFCNKREPSPNEFALDIFYQRLLKVKDRINTKTAKIIAERRNKILETFLEELKLELKGK